MHLFISALREMPSLETLAGSILCCFRTWPAKHRVHSTAPVPNLWRFRSTSTSQARTEKRCSAFQSPYLPYGPRVQLKCSVVSYNPTRIGGEHDTRTDLLPRHIRGPRQMPPSMPAILIPHHEWTPRWKTRTTELHDLGLGGCRHILDQAVYAIEEAVETVE